MSTQEKLVEAARSLGSMYIIRDRVSRLASNYSGIVRAELEALRAYLDSLLTNANRAILSGEYEYVERTALRVCRLIEMTFGDLGVGDETINRICASLVSSQPSEAPPIQ